MGQDIIVAEHLSKKYQLGEFNTGTFSHDMNRAWHRMWKKEDPYQKIEQQGQHQVNTTIWSLRDLNFSVAEGEVFGIVGKNGAGKSTLLKLLSKITKPTEGCIKLDGKLASLLEVGTGFHPDLSGRENIFLNGAILGMRKHEIKSRFDEIVAFSGIEPFIDTPVKRYSSGMYVRLAFAVAAHLEPDILVIDEVLAVGDAEFQQKCIGKMQGVARDEGRTILFVSHNHAAIKRLCTRAMLLEKGTVKMIDTPDHVLEAYQVTVRDSESGIRNNHPKSPSAYFSAWKLIGNQLPDPFSCYSRDRICISLQFRSTMEIHQAVCHVLIRDEEGNTLIYGTSLDNGAAAFQVPEGNSAFRIELSLPLKKGSYLLEFGLSNNESLVDYWQTTTKLVVLDKYEHHHANHQGILNLPTHFSMQPELQLVNG